jgi:hypothetical protein
VDHTVRDEARTEYKVGDVVECSADTAQHFTRRHLAVDCEAPGPPVEEKAAEQESKPAGRKVASKKAGDDVEQSS